MNNIYMNKEFEVLSIHFESVSYYVYSSCEVIDELIRRIKMDKEAKQEHINSATTAFSHYIYDAKYSIEEFKKKISALINVYRNDERNDDLIMIQGLLESVVLYINQYIFLFDRLSEINDIERIAYKEAYMICLMDIQEVAIKLSRTWDKVAYYFNQNR